MSSNTSHSSHTSTPPTTTYTAPPSYAQLDVSSTKSTSSTVKNHLLSVFNRKLSSSETPTKTTKAPSGKDGLTTEERKIRNEARASCFSTLG
ncbi:uncharacterized protein M421DRAFT_127177 [Didymella exigua CBS 183.55]|uniref:Uncharacterized protein n=1 Tax=Didymella exigua CBS 183.55 TaxID=1150837 RepID=A0A6A5RQW6_9PLEO|nr:uncharacterized protein M421DRAFT_127177 [Didymella exigua CBS 183.55]KAF1929720.1 hypothetical protein M421DRAFT_127177 [Didymella exigua CBS 183.55]